MKKHEMTVGLLPTHRDVFNPAVAQAVKRSIEAQLKSWGVRFVNIDWLNDEGLLYSGADVPAVAARFREAGVDCVFAPHCDFGTEYAVAQVAREVGKPVLLWGPRDSSPAPDGTRDRDTQCGLFATSKVLRRLNVPFTYVINSRVDSPVFERGFKDFLGVASAANAFLGARIGQLDTRPAPFWTVMANEGELLERWGVQVVPITLVDVEREVKRRVAAPDATLKQAVAGMRAAADLSQLAEDAILRLAALKVTLAAWAERERLDALAVQCWSAMQEAIGLFPCFSHAVLTDEGLPVACETDIHGALTSILLHAAARYTTPTFFADLTIRHPEDENAELLWHCGPFPPSLADPASSPCVSTNFMAKNDCPGCSQWRIKGGDVTLARLDGDHGQYSLLVGQARGTTGPHTRGTYLWVQVGDWPRWEQRLIYGPYVHHIVGVHGRLAPVLVEACKYIPGLAPDPVEPDAEEVAAYWRGQGI